MIKLSDYMDYLNEEIVLARKKADEQAVLIAKEYAKHPYLKYFRVPRFTMPTVKLEIPIKISELNSETKYNFKMDKKAFINDVNKQIRVVNDNKKLNLNPISDKTLENKEFKSVFEKLEKTDHKYVRKLEDNLLNVDLKGNVDKIVRAKEFSVSSDKKTEADIEMKKIIQSALENRYKPVSAKLNDIYFSPDTKEKGKDEISLQLNVELVEEGIRIHNAKDENGNVIEEIIFE